MRPLLMSVDFVIFQIPGGFTEEFAQEGTEIQSCDGDAVNVDKCKLELIVTNFAIKQRQKIAPS